METTKDKIENQIMVYLNAQLITLKHSNSLCTRIRIPCSEVDGDMMDALDARQVHPPDGDLFTL